MAFDQNERALALAQVVAVIAKESLTVNTFTLAWNLIMDEARFADNVKAKIVKSTLRAFSKRYQGISG